ncbi:60S ribosomal protein L24 [Phellopilus nigrolimitatus]|nr:60S ribosomal protein L24 [Phellopilus nigrolimitatus]
MKVEIDSFSGYKIYPSKGRLFVRGDSKVFRFANGKNESLFLQRKNPRKIAWTQVYRRMHKKGLAEEASKKRTRRTVKHQRGIVGADLAAIAARRNQTEIDRTKARQAAIARAKAEKKDKESKKDKTKVRPNVPSGPKVSKQQMKGGKAVVDRSVVLSVGVFLFSLCITRTRMSSCC